MDVTSIHSGVCLSTNGLRHAGKSLTEKFRLQLCKQMSVDEMLGAHRPPLHSPESLLLLFISQRTQILWNLPAALV